MRCRGAGKGKGTKCMQGFMRAHLSRDDECYEIKKNRRVRCSMPGGGACGSERLVVQGVGGGWKRGRAACTRRGCGPGAARRKRGGGWGACGVAGCGSRGSPACKHT